MLCLTPKGVGNLICPIRDSLSCNYYSSDKLSSGMHVIVDLRCFIFKREEMSCLQVMILGLNHLLVDQLKKHNQIGGVWGGGKLRQCRQV
jgi:hypothetical protein